MFCSQELFHQGRVGTDPVTVVALLHEFLGASEKLGSLSEAKLLLNDTSSAVEFEIKIQVMKPFNQWHALKIATTCQDDIAAEPVRRRQ